MYNQYGHKLFELDDINEAYRYLYRMDFPFFLDDRKDYKNLCVLKANMKKVQDFTIEEAIPSILRVLADTGLHYQVTIVNLETYASLMGTYLENERSRKMIDFLFGQMYGLPELWLTIGNLSRWFSNNVFEQYIKSSYGGMVGEDSISTKLLPHENFTFIYSFINDLFRLL